VCNFQIVVHCNYVCRSSPRHIHLLRRLDEVTRYENHLCLLSRTASVCRSIPRSILQSLVTSLVLTRRNHVNATLAVIPLYLLKRFQSVTNSAARLMFFSSRYDHITPLLRQLHWLKAPDRIDYKLALLVYKCRQDYV